MDLQLINETLGIEFNLIISIIGEINECEKGTIIITYQDGEIKRGYDKSKLEDLKSLYFDENINHFTEFEFIDRIEMFMRNFISNEILLQSVAWLINSSAISENIQI